MYVYAYVHVFRCACACITYRARTEKIYTVFSKKPRAEIHAALRSLRVAYVVLERGSCLRRASKPGCTSVEIWDRTDPTHAYVGHTFCDQFLQSISGTLVDPSKLNPSLAPHFALLYATPNYAVLQLL